MVTALQRQQPSARLFYVRFHTSAIGRQWRPQQQLLRAVQGSSWRVRCLNEAARAADATREALGAVVASQLG
jgi:hypothetical protein